MKFSKKLARPAAPPAAPPEAGTLTERMLTRVRVCLLRFRAPLPLHRDHYAQGKMLGYRLFRLYYLRLEAYLERRAAR